MKDLKENDIVVYAYSGNELFKQSKFILRFAIFVAKSKSIFFNTPFCEKFWSKHEAHSFFRLNEHDLERPQKHATFFILRNDKKTKKLIALWYRSSVYKDFSLINDFTKNRNLLLKDHRHDQSILSGALKHLKFGACPWDLHVDFRFYHKKSWIYYFIPIHPLRNRSNTSTLVTEHGYIRSIYLNVLLVFEILKHIFRGLLIETFFGRGFIKLIRFSLGKETGI